MLYKIIYKEKVLILIRLTHLPTYSPTYRIRDSRRSGVGSIKVSKLVLEDLDVG